MSVGVGSFDGGGPQASDHDQLAVLPPVAVGGGDGGGEGAHVGDIPVGAEIAVRREAVPTPVCWL